MMDSPNSRSEPPAMRDLRENMEKLGLKCPTCGSNDPAVRRNLFRRDSQETMPCPDAFHSPSDKGVEERLGQLANRDDLNKLPDNRWIVASPTYEIYPSDGSDNYPEAGTVLVPATASDQRVKELETLTVEAVEKIEAMRQETREKCEAKREFPDEFHVLDGKQGGLFWALQLLKPLRSTLRGSSDG